MAANQRRSATSKAPNSLRGPRFSLATMMLLMLVCSVTAAGGYYMVKATEKGTSSKSLFVIFTLASPFVLLLALSVITTLQKVMRKLKRRKKTRVGDSPWDKP